MTCRESDHIIIPSIAIRDRKGKGVTKLRSPQRKYGLDMKGQGNMQTSLRGIIMKAKADKKSRFGNLYGLLNEANLLSCFRELRKNAVPGADKVDYWEYKATLSENISNLVTRLKSFSYHAKLILRKFIPKSKDKLRPLGLPVIEDKLLQLGVSKILNAIFEPLFTKSSFGYRPEIGPINAVQELTFNLQYGKFGWLAEADIQGFFDNINHDWMIRMLQEKIEDRSFLGLIMKWLKAGILEKDGSVTTPDSGTPQGGIVSPILANIYLHYVLDIWFENVFKPSCRGQAMLVRYADDFICAFQFKADAERFYSILGDRLGKFNLKVAPEKTRIIRFSRFHTTKNEGFEFLSFEFRWQINRKGKPQVKRRTSPKKLRAAINKFKEWIRGNRNLTITELFKKLRSKYTGYWNYFGIHDNSKGMGRYYYHTTNLMFKWLNRRSQRHSYNWQGFRDLLITFKIPAPRITEKSAKWRNNFLWA